MEVTLQVSESSFSALRTTPENFAREMKLAAVVKWYELGRISQSKGAEMFGVSRAEFLRILGDYKCLSSSMTKTCYPTHLPVLDDSAAKACCRAFGLRTLGTGVILILGKQDGLLSSVREPLEMMRAKGMWIADSVIHLLCKRVGEK